MSKIKLYTPVLVEGTDDHYKVYTDNRGTMLAGDQLGRGFIRLSDLYHAIERCEGDVDLLKFFLPKEGE